MWSTLSPRRKSRPTFENEADDGWGICLCKDGYAVYRNTNYVPMGFAYDYYLTQTEYEETAKTTRANLLMRALVLTDEDAAVYGKYLTHLPEGQTGGGAVL